MMSSYFRQYIAYILSQMSKVIQSDSKSIRITLYLLVSSVNNLYKQFGPRPAQQNVGHDLDTNFLTLIIFLKEFFEMVDFEEKIFCKPQ